MGALKRKEARTPLINYGSVLITIEFVTFFVDRNNICYFEYIWKYTLIKQHIFVLLKGFENSFLSSFKILIDILFGSTALFSLNLLRLLCPQVLLEKEKCFCFQGQDTEDEGFFCFDNVCLFFQQYL